MDNGNQRIIRQDAMERGLLLSSAHPSRRTLLKSALAAPLAALPPLVLPSLARATTLTGIMATGFQNARIQNDGTMRGLPVTTTKIYKRYLYNSSVTGVFTHCIFNLSPSSANKNVIQIRHQSVSTKKNSAYLYVGISGGNATTALGGQSAAGSLPMDGAWHSVAIKGDTSAGTLSVKLDDLTLASFQVTERVGIPFNMPCLTYGDGSTLRWAYGSYVASSSFYGGALAECYAFFAQDINASDPNVIAAFTDPATGLPRRAGDYPVVADANNNILAVLRPQIHLWGGPNQFLLNQPNWTVQPWSWTSPPTARIDDGPNKFYLAAGALQTPTRDPWGFGGET